MKMLAELDAVVRLMDSGCRPDEYRCAAANFLCANAYHITNMANRLEAADRDAARYAFLKRRVYVEDHYGGCSSDFKFYAIARHSDSIYKGAKPFRHETLDDAIDASIQAGEATKP